ncbi:hypothetical protein HDV02_001884 [Globomyces sp. JEL0801]|nr:hypothetical protein HDV02_001884 [Globomyces sp. JEL0801]
MISKNLDELMVMGASLLGALGGTMVVFIIQKLPQNNFFYLLWLMAMTDIWLSGARIIYIIGPKIGPDSNWDLYRQMSIFANDLLSCFATAIALISLYIVKCGGSVESISWQKIAFVSCIPGIIFGFLDNLLGSQSSEQQILEFSFLTLNYLVMMGSFMIVTLELNQQAKLRKQTLSTRRKTRGTKLMIKFINHFVIISTMVWTPYIGYCLLRILYPGCKKKYPEFVNIVHTIGMMSTSSNGLLLAIAMFLGLRKNSSHLQVAIPVRNELSPSPVDSGVNEPTIKTVPAPLDSAVTANSDDTVVTLSIQL